MIDIVSVPPVVQAALLVVVVLVEALGLYAGYGALERVIGPSILETVENV